MSDHLNVDICVIGAGSGGLSVAAGASQMGASVVLVEKGAMGGDCLNFGCVPSKALLAAGHAARAHLDGGPFGVTYGAPDIDGGAVFDHVRRTIAAIAPLDSVERFEGLGVTVIRDAARFTGPQQVAAGGRTIRARRVVVATGSGPFVPPIPGLDTVPYLTNETLFDQTGLPGHLIVIGGGPIGMEMAQAHRHLGCRVTVLEAARIMPKDDPELVEVLRRQLDADGLVLREGAQILRVERDGDGIAVVLKAGDDGGGGEERLTADRLLVATGRRPAVDGLDLDKAGVAFSAKGIQVDARLRTTNKKVYAIGDVAGGMQFTHLAGYHAGVVIKNALFRWPAKADHSAIPWVTYTAPELAQVGLTAAQAKETAGDIRVLRWPFADNDRARAERRIDGLVKAVATPKGKVLGAGIVGARAGELIQPWVLAVQGKLTVGDLAQTVAPYPTLGEASKRAAASFYTASLFGPRTKKLVRFLARFG
ncbi:MAG: FAD-dependent oxidoreductase [Hyphomicrobiales bacterium]|nr:FAD-dependent oxidoreductase [Hyphomicrobiales bacterium]